MNINYGFSLGVIGIALSVGYVGKKAVGKLAEAAFMAFNGYALANKRVSYSREEIDKLSGRISWIGVPIGLMAARMVLVSLFDALIPRYYF